MGLKVWLPLNGDLRNQGCADVTVTNNGTTVNANGKIGSCYEFGTNKYIKLVDYAVDFLTYNEFSLSVWFKCTAQNTAHSGSALISGGNWNQANNLLQFSLGSFSNDHYTKLLISGSGGWSNGYSYNFYLNTWYHVVLTSGNGKMRAYVNGQLIGDTYNAFKPASLEQTWICIGNGTYSQSFHFIGLMNDVRIYDHCLSAAEVREISQGLVLHYKLDGGLFGNPNLLLNTHFDSRYNQTTGWDTAKNGTLLANNWGGYNSGVANQATCYHAHLKLFNAEYVYEYIKDTETWLGISQGGLQTKLVAGKKYTFSCEQYSVTNTNYMHGGLFYCKTGATSSSFHLGYIKCNTNRQQGTWQKFTYTFTAPSDGDYSKNMSWYCYGHSGGAGTFYLRHLKLEEGSVATPWCPADSELTIDRTHIQDSSGYGNNGIINSNPIISSETMRYNHSLSFDGVDDCIKIPFNDIIKDKNYTVSVWTYKTSIGTKNYQTILGGPSGFELEARSSASTSPLYRIHNWGGGTTAYEFNKWNLFTFVHTDSNSKLYVNGELKITGTSANIPTGNYYIGAWNSVTGQNYEGLMSDFRIYCTALDADAIRQLYEVGAKVDDKQNLHTFEIKETNNNLLAGRVFTSSYGSKNPITNPFTNFNSNGEYQFTTNSASMGSEYIPINPTGHTYLYDVVFSANAGNQFDIGFERFDADKTARANSACTYIYASNSSTDLVKKHIQGTVNLSTDGVNPCAFISLRVLNGWSGTTSGVTGTATIHNISLREVSTLQTTKLIKTGQFIEEEIKEEDNMKIQKNGIIETSQIIEV